MKELEEIEAARRIKSIPFALRLAAFAVFLNLIPLGMTFNAYTSDPNTPPLEGNFVEKFDTVSTYLMEPAQKDKTLGLKIFLLAVPLGLVMIIFGVMRGSLRYLVPLLASLAFAIGLNHVLLLILWDDPDAFSPWWMAASSVVGLVAVIWGAANFIRQSVLLKTGLHLVGATFLSLLVTLLFPLILGGMALYLHKKRNVAYAEFFAQSGSFYNFLIMNIYPVCFQIIPTIRMVIKKGKIETRANKKKYRNVEPPVYHSELDFGKMKVGDVILSGKPTWKNSAPIQASNILSSSEEYRFWSHAFIYVGSRPDETDNPAAPRRNIVEAQSGGKGVQEIDMLTGQKVIYENEGSCAEPVIVTFTEQDMRQFNFDENGNRKKYTKEQIEKFTEKEKQLYFEKSYFEEGYYLKVLRSKHTSPESLEKIVAFCRKKDWEGYGYDTWGVTFYSLCALIPPMLSGWLESAIAKKIFNVSDAYFCSELVADAFLSENQQMFDRSPWRVKPLDFYMNPLFEEVDCGYRRTPINESAKREVAEQVAYLEEQEKKVHEMAETSTEVEKQQLEKVLEKIKQATIRAESGLYPTAPISTDMLLTSEDPA